jgi:hypothetical protein
MRLLDWNHWTSRQARERPSGAILVAALSCLRWSGRCVYGSPHTLQTLPQYERRLSPQSLKALQVVARKSDRTPT